MERVFLGEEKKEEQSRTFKLPLVSKVAPQSRLKVHKKRSKPPSEQGPAALFHPFLVPHLSTHTTPPIPKFPKRGILKTYKKLLELPSQFEKVHKVLDENYFWKIFRIKKRKARNTPPVRAYF